MLREANLLTLFDKDLDAYDLWFYLLESLHHETSCRALIDFNVFKDILSIARPGDKRNPKDRQLGAALLAFFQLADIEIDPSSAIHESPGQAREEIPLFQMICHANPSDLLKVAFGKIDQIPEHRLPTPVRVTANLEQIRQPRNYETVKTAVLILKILYKY